MKSNYKTLGVYNGVGKEKCSSVPAPRNFFKQGIDGILKMDGGGHGGGFHL